MAIILNAFWVLNYESKLCNGYAHKNVSSSINGIVDEKAPARNSFRGNVARVCICDK